MEPIREYCTRMFHFSHFQSYFGLWGAEICPSCFQSEAGYSLKNHERTHGNMRRLHIQRLWDQIHVLLVVSVNCSAVIKDLHWEPPSPPCATTSTVMPQLHSIDCTDRGLRPHPKMMIVGKCHYSPFHSTLADIHSQQLNSLTIFTHVPQSLSVWSLKECERATLSEYSPATNWTNLSRVYAHHLTPKACGIRPSPSKTGVENKWMNGRGE